MALKHGITTAKTWEGDRDETKQKLFWWKGGEYPKSIHATMFAMEEYLEEIRP